MSACTDNVVSDVVTLPPNSLVSPAQILLARRFGTRRAKICIYTVAYTYIMDNLQASSENETENKQKAAINIMTQTQTRISEEDMCTPCQKCVHVSVLHSRISSKRPFCGHDMLFWVFFLTPWPNCKEKNISIHRQQKFTRPAPCHAYIYTCAHGCILRCCVFGWCTCTCVMCVYIPQGWHTYTHGRNTKSKSFY